MRAARISILTVGILLSVSAFSQKVNISASLDTNAIMIGQQFRLKLKVDRIADLSVVWPQIGDSLTKGVEVVDVMKTDTLFSDNKERITFHKDYILTSFDSGAYSIPPLRFVATTGNVADTILTDPLFIKVNRPAVDTTQGIKDIKGPLEIPFDWREYIPHVLVGFGVVILIVLAVFFVLRYIRKRREAKANMPAYVPPPIPADVKALTALKELSEKQLWQRGKIKEYYTELTDILRVYIKDVYRIDAPEMLTDEILHHLRFKDIAGEHKQALKVVLELADMVKFAKVQPNDTENTESFHVASRFVQDTASAIAADKARKESKDGEKREGGSDEL